MAAIIKEVYNAYHTLNVDWADPRVENYFLMQNPFPLAVILIFYIYFIFKLGPKLMENRRPYNIDKLLVVFNFLQIVACSYVVYYYAKTILFKYNHFCEPIDYSNTEEAIELTRFVWFYFIIKIVDLFDTVFFVLRKKYSQITFLHVYHHAGMCLLTWTGTKYVAGGHGLFIGCINSFVHVVMYFYYLLTAWDKKYKENIWWKKHLTQLQIFQFLWVSLHFMQILFQPNCKYPKWIVFAIMPQNILMVILFTNFYIHAYVKPKKVVNNKIEKLH
ncbi:hypothetical protein RN001_012334 [Aquatica leii]|uniref:Elongation of very long chain fatty acids protein n=1 Tax=Aquatica leii TaxID=1421715 RepID=A0AAN7SD92_9COLE|nr:hypothetical protein RN001_012334 [Aquatica leii]